jgi:hypothetical protein
MRTPKQVTSKIHQLLKEKERVQKIFEEYDNHEDMHYLTRLDYEIELLEWVLNENN